MTISNEIRIKQKPNRLTELRNLISRANQATVRTQKAAFNALQKTIESYKERE